MIYANLLIRLPSSDHPYLARYCLQDFLNPSVFLRSTVSI